MILGMSLNPGTNKNKIELNSSIPSQGTIFLNALIQPFWFKSIFDTDLQTDSILTKLFLYNISDIEINSHAQANNCLHQPTSHDLIMILHLIHPIVHAFHKWNAMKSLKQCCNHTFFWSSFNHGQVPVPAPPLATATSSPRPSRPSTPPPPSDASWTESTSCPTGSPIHCATSSSRRRRRPRSSSGEGRTTRPVSWRTRICSTPPSWLWHAGHFPGWVGR